MLLGWPLGALAEDDTESDQAVLVDRPRQDGSLEDGAALPGPQHLTQPKLSRSAPTDRLCGRILALVVWGYDAPHGPDRCVVESDHPLFG